MMYMVSACLVGVNCRYNAESTCNEHLIRLMKDGQLLPVCPEVLGGLPIPRPPCELLTEEDGAERVVDRTGEDRTDAFQMGARRTLEICRAAGINQAILQQRSPSCGCGSIYDGSFTGRLIPGKGMTARLLSENGIEIIPEEHWCYFPLAYCSDPASFECEDSIIDFYKADLETDTRKIIAFLEADKL